MVCAVATPASYLPSWFFGCVVLVATAIGLWHSEDVVPLVKPADCLGFMLFSIVLEIVFLIGDVVAGHKIGQHMPLRQTIMNARGNPYGFVLAVLLGPAFIVVTTATFFRGIFLSKYGSLSK